MASKFQNRLVGTVIIVALGVIVLPGLLDGKKKHYKEEFAAIPLVPEPGDQQETEMVPPVTQSLPAQPPEGAGSAVSGQQGGNTSQAESGSIAPQTPTHPTVVDPPPVQVSRPVQQPVEKPKPAEKPRLIETPKPAEAAKPKPAVKTPDKPNQEPQPARQERAPAGEAWIIQLVALNNASRANELVAQLRLSGYRVYTVPSTPVQGQLTRIFVGPDASKAKMIEAARELKNMTKLDGRVIPYSAR